MKEEGKFEGEWKKVFDGAEAVPTESVWDNIDHELALAEGVVMKKRMATYQRIAAASILFALLAGAFGVYHWLDNKQAAHLQFEKSTLTIKKKSDVELKVAQKDNLPISATHENENIIHSKEATMKKSDFKNNLTKSTSNDNSLILNANTEKKRALTKRDIAPSKMDEMNQVKNIEPNENELGNNLLAGNEMIELPHLYLLPIAKIAGEPMVIELTGTRTNLSESIIKSSQEKNKHEQWWVSLTASGNFQSNGYSSNAYAGVNTKLAHSTSSSFLGTSYSLGLILGRRISERAVLQVGIQYLNQSSTNNFIVGTSALAYSQPNSQSARLASYVNNSIVSTNEFIAVPIQAGYLLSNKKNGVQFNAGVSTDFLLRNTLLDSSGNLPNYTQSAGEGSPYRLVNFVGLLNLELSRKIGSRFRMSFVPGYRYPLNSVAKNNSSLNFNYGSSWDLGLRLRYILK